MPKHTPAERKKNKKKKNTGQRLSNAVQTMSKIGKIMGVNPTSQGKKKKK